MNFQECIDDKLMLTGASAFAESRKSCHHSHTWLGCRSMKDDASLGTSALNFSLYNDIALIMVLFVFK